MKTIIKNIDISFENVQTAFSISEAVEAAITLREKSKTETISFIFNETAISISSNDKEAEVRHAYEQIVFSHHLNIMKTEATKIENEDPVPAE